MKTVCIYALVLLAFQAQASLARNIVPRNEALLRHHVVAKRSIPSLMKLLGLDRWLQSEDIATQTTDAPDTETEGDVSHVNSLPAKEGSAASLTEENKSAKEHHHKSKRSIEPLLTVDRILHAPHQKFEKVLGSLPGGNLLVHNHGKERHQPPVLNLNDILTSVGLQPLKNNTTSPPNQTATVQPAVVESATTELAVEAVRTTSSPNGPSSLPEGHAVTVEQPKSASTAPASTPAAAPASTPAAAPASTPAAAPASTPAAAPASTPAAAPASTPAAAPASTPAAALASTPAAAPASTPAAAPASTPESTSAAAPESTSAPLLAANDAENSSTKLTAGNMTGSNVTSRETDPQPAAEPLSPELGTSTLATESKEQTSASQDITAETTTVGSVSSAEQSLPEERSIIPTSSAGTTIEAESSSTASDDLSKREIVSTTQATSETPTEGVDPDAKSMPEVDSEILSTEAASTTDNVPKAEFESTSTTTSASS